MQGKDLSGVSSWSEPRNSIKPRTDSIIKFYSSHGSIAVLIVDVEGSE